MSDQEIPQQTGLTRREVLKKGAVLGGALAWGTPVVQVIGMRPAVAQVTSPTCENLYCVKAEFSGSTLGIFQNCSPGVNRGQGRGNCLAISGQESDFDQASFEFRTSIQVESTLCPSHEDGSPVEGIKITLPAGCDLALIGEQTGTPDAFTGDRAAAAKCGLKGETLVDACDPPTDVGEDAEGRTTICFPIECSNGTSISHIELILCCA